MFRTLLYPILLSLAIIIPASADDAVELEYSYAEGSSSGWGTGRDTSYDVAIRIYDPSMYGSYIKGVRVPLAPSGGSLSEDVAVWVSSTLALDAEGKNMADIARAEGKLIGSPALKKGEVPDTPPYISIDFPEKVLIPEGGVYVGYSLTVTGVYNYTMMFPHQLVDSERKGGLFVHDSKKYTDWTDCTEQLGKASAMKVLIEVDRHENATSLVIPADSYIEVEKSGKLRVELINHGSQPLKSVGYTFAFEGEEPLEEGTLTLDTPLVATYGARTEVELPLPERSVLGLFPYTLTLTSVNGERNADNVAQARSLLHVLDFMPVTRPLLEDVTGFWCAGCASSFVKLKEMHDEYPDLVAVSIHNKDQIAAVPSALYPLEVNGFPTFWINRKTPMRGDFDAEWERELRKLAPAAVEVEAEWADAEHTRLRARAEARFIDDASDVDYRMAFVLIGDGMSDPAWGQRNSYSGRTDLTGKYWEPFVNGGHQVFGLVYDDIALIYSSMNGEPGSVPSLIKAGERYGAEYEFDLADAVCNFNGGINYGNNIVKDKNLLRVVAYVYDAKSGRVVNSTVSSYMGGSGVEQTLSDSDILSTHFYDLHGRQLPAPPAEGLYIRQTRNADGTQTSRLVRTVR